MSTTPSPFPPLPRTGRAVTGRCSPSRGANYGHGPARKVIVTCAVTGSVHVPSQSPYLPLTPEQIAENAIGAAEAGAAILHLHARDPENGQPTPDPEMFMQLPAPRSKSATDAVVNITTGGGQGMTLEQRLAAAMRAKPEMCSLNMGSMNFGRYPIASRIKEWRFDWEAGRPREPRATTSSATPTPTSSTSCASSARPTASASSSSATTSATSTTWPTSSTAGWSTAPLRPDHSRHPRRHRHRPRGPAAHEADRRPPLRRRLPLVDPRRRPPPVQPGHDGRDHGRQRPRRPGGQHLPRQGRAGRANADLVAKIVRILGELSLEPATPDEARDVLGLKGAAKVGF